MLLTLVLKNISSIPFMKTMIFLLNNSKELREFLGFLTIPLDSQFSRFKSNFLDDLGDLFHNPVDATEEIAKEINPYLSSILVTDTTGFEPYVTENNPKFFHGKLKQSQAYAKKFNKDNHNPNFDLQKYTQDQMPKYASSNPNTKSLIHTPETFFTLHPDFLYKYFLGDAGFDADDNYAYLHKKCIMPIISLNSRNIKTLPGTDFNQFGVPLCPYDDSLPMVYDRIAREKGRADRIKYICPKVKKTKVNGKTNYILNCDNPCTSSKCGRIKNITIHNNYRFNTSIPRDSIE